MAASQEGLSSMKLVSKKDNSANLYEEQIITPRELYKWTAVKISSVTFENCTAEEHSKETVQLKEPFRKT
jgi:hypothetical protein